MIKPRLIAVALLFLVTAAPAGAASVGTGGIGTAFSKGSTTFGIVLGSGSAFNDNYTIVGAGVGYYVARGLELGIDAQYWLSGDPSISMLSPQLRYVFTRAGKLKPYLGVFYRRTFIDSAIYKDYNSYGGRAGLYFSTTGRVYIGAGLVYEQYADCGQFTDCSTSYPEILVQFGF